MKTCLLATCVSIALGLPGGVVAQDLGSLREDLRQSVRRDRYIQGLVALVDFSQARTVGGASYRVENAADQPALRISTFRLPWEWSPSTAGPAVDVEGVAGGPPDSVESVMSARDATSVSDTMAAGDIALWTEGVFGLFAADYETPDLYGGSLPQLATRVDSTWQAASTSVGVGPRIALDANTFVKVLARGGIAYVENTTDYSGVGRDVTRDLTDRILFNWNATLLSAGAAVELGRTDLLSGSSNGGLRLESELRYDGMWSTTVHTTDSAQEGDVTTHALAARVDLVGPTGWTQCGQPIDWRVWAGASHFPGDTGDALGFESLFQVGAGLETGVESWGLPLLAGLDVSAAFLFGDDVRGFSIGIGVSF